MSKLKPRYSMWDGIRAALDLGRTALEEVRAMKREPGPPGLGFDDFEMVETDIGVMLRFARGETVKEYRLPVVRDCGIWREGNTYRKGDGVTWGGSFWICQEETSDKPDGSKGWRLAVKKGRDGKDGIVKDVKHVVKVSV